MPHLAAYMWLMIKEDKWFTVLNCPLTVWCLLECGALPVAPSGEGHHHSISLCLSSLFLCVCVCVCVCVSVCTAGCIISWQLVSVEVKFDSAAEMLTCIHSAPLIHLTCNILLPHLSHMLRCSCLINVVDASPRSPSDQFQWANSGPFPESSDGSLFYQWGALSPVT